VNDIAYERFATGQILIDGGPFGREFDPALFHQFFKLIEFRRAAVRLDEIRDEHFVFEQETELRLAEAKVDGFGDDPRTSAETFLARAGPHEIEVREGDEVDLVGGSGRAGIRCPDDTPNRNKSAKHQHSPGTKHQPPSSREAPNSKLQIPRPIAH